MRYMYNMCKITDSNGTSLQTVAIQYISVPYMINGITITVHVLHPNP